MCVCVSMYILKTYIVCILLFYKTYKEYVYIYIYSFSFFLLFSLCEPLKVSGNLTTDPVCTYKTSIGYMFRHV